MMGVSVVIPAFNEAKRIIATLEQVKDFLAEHSITHEIIVVDDGSTDDTARLVRSVKGVVLLQNGHNRGKGFSVRMGVLSAKLDYVLFSDADLSTPIRELKAMLPLMDKYDIVFGSRRLNASKVLVRQPWYRRIPGAVFPFLVYLLIIRGVRDSQCGFKLFRKQAAKDLFSIQRLDRFSFDAEILFLARKRGYKIREVPVVWVNALDSKLNAVTDSFGMFVELLKIRLNYFLGRYDGKSLNCRRKS